MNEVQEAAALETILTDLGGSATADQIIQAIEGYSDLAIATALRRLGGGTPSTPDLAAVLTEGGDPDGHAITGALTVDPAAGDGGIIVLEADPNEAPAITIGSEATSHGLLVNSGNAIAIQSDDGANPLTVKLGDVGGTTQFAVFGNGYIFFSNFVNRFNPAGHFVITSHAAPADGDIDAGDCAFWFDQTNGAGKLMIKAKTANGTIVTGNVALT